MKLLLSLILLLFFVTVHAKESYPLAFATQGTPLYKDANSFKLLEKYLKINILIKEYKTKASSVKKFGFEVDKSEDKKTTFIYLKSLRTLQNKHDNIIGYSAKLLNDAIKKNDYRQFSDMVNFGIFYYKERPKLKEKITSYYKKNRRKGRISSLDKIMRYDRRTTTLYDTSKRVYMGQDTSTSTPTQNQNIQNQNVEDEDITLISMSGCGYCVKAKALLDKSGKSYRELNVKSSKGSRIFKKYNGRGLPLIIIGNKVIRGYSKSAILDAI